MYPKTAIMQSKGKLLSEVNLAKILEDYKSDEVLLRVNGNGTEGNMFGVGLELAPYIDRLHEEGSHSIVLVKNRGNDRLGGLSRLKVVSLSEPVFSTSPRKGEPFLEPDVVLESSVSQSYSRGENYSKTCVIGVRNPQSKRKKPTYLPLLD